MKILVTGCAGYIGSVICEYLCDNGFTVMGLDNLSHGYRESVDSRVEFHMVDIRNVLEVGRRFNSFKPDVVCHLAAESIITDSMNNPKPFFDVNIKGGISILDNMKEVGCNKLIMSSTASVYGEPEYTPMDENHPKNPVNAYGESKYLFERILRWYQKAYGINFIAFRYFNVGGATEKHGEKRRIETRLVPIAIKAALNNTSMEIFGSNYNTMDGTPMRDYVHVKDIANAHLIGIEKICEGTSGYLNLGGDRPYSVLEIINKVELITNKKINYTFSDRRPGDVEIFWATSELARICIGWKAEHSSLLEIIKDSVNWFKNEQSL